MRTDSSCIARPTPPTARPLVCRSRSSCTRRARTARETALHETIRHLAAAGPQFISVTFGAGGSAGGRSLDVLRYIRRRDRCRAAGAHHVRRQHLRRRDRAHPRVPGCRHPELPRAARRPARGRRRGRLLPRRPRERRASSCSSSTGCRRAALAVHRGRRSRASRRRTGPATSARPRSRSPPSPTDTRARGIRTSTSTRSWPSRPPERPSRSRSCSSMPTTTWASSPRSREAGVTIPILPGIMPITSPGRLRRRARAHRRGAARASSRSHSRSRPTAEGQAEVGIAHAADLAQRGARRRRPRHTPVRLQRARHGARGAPRGRHPHPLAPEGMPPR